MQKQKQYLKSCLLIGLFFILGCGGGDDDMIPGPDPDRPRTSTDVINDFNNLSINEGINDLELESLIEGVFWKFRLIVPAGATADNRRPLVLRLHGGARAGVASAHLSTACLVEPAFEGKDVFILSPNSNGDLWYEQINQVQALALMDLTTSRFNIDQKKVVLTGYSDGGNGSWFYAQYYEDLITAAIPLASSYNTTNSSGQTNKINVPLYVIHGTEDDLFPIDITKSFVDESVAAGSDITFVTADGLVHNEPCTYIDYMKDAVEWLETEVW